MHATTTPLSTHRRRRDAPGYNRHYNYGSAYTRVDARSNASQPTNKPVQPVLHTEFYLDTMFSPVWMSGPHVFSFAKDGTVVRPATHCAEPYPGYRPSGALSAGRNVHGAGTTSSLSGSSRLPLILTSFPRADVSEPSVRIDKPWKNVAITEQDDAGFAAMEAAVEASAQAEAKSKLVGLVYTWPPQPLPAPCADCKVLVNPQRREVIGREKIPWISVWEGPDARTATPESVMPALSYGSSSGDSESESEIFKVVPGRRAMGHGKEGPLEKSINFGRVGEKKPPASAGMDEGENESY